jgi:SPP1 family predicted phage head-tail adaptor
MLAQRLRHRITIQEKTYEQDSNSGENSVTWSDVLADEPAEVVPSSVREFRAAGAKQGESLGRITIRKPAFAIDHTMRVVWQGVNYQIDGVMPDPSDRRWLTIAYSQGVNDGQ